MCACPPGEIDLVVKRGATIVIAEVKTRQSLFAGEGHEAVDRAQARAHDPPRRSIRGAASRGAAALRHLSLFWTGRRFVVTHYEDAFRPIADAQRPWIWRAP